MNKNNDLLELLKKRELGIEKPNFPNYINSKLDQLKISNISIRKQFSCPVNKIDLDKQDSRYLLSGYNNGKIAIFDTKIKRSNNFIDSIAVTENIRACHQSHIKDVLWYPHDTGLFLSLGDDKIVKIWDTNKVEVADEYKFSVDIFSFSVSERAKKHSLIAVSAGDASIYLCDMKTGSKSHILKEHQASVNYVKWSPRTANILFSGCSDGYIKAWDIRKTRSSLQTLFSKDIAGHKSMMKAHKGAVTGFVFSPEGYQLLSFGRDNRLILWDLWTGENLNIDFGQIKNSTYQTMTQMAFHSVSSSVKLAFIPSGVSVKVLNVSNGIFENTLCGHFSNVNGCLFNGNDSMLYTYGNDYQIVAWDTCNNSQLLDDHVYADNWSDDELIPSWRDFLVKTD